MSKEMEAFIGIALIAVLTLSVVVSFILLR
jgi:hypothetical protein